MFAKTVETISAEYERKSSTLRKSYFDKLMGIVDTCNSRVANAERGIEALNAEKEEAERVRKEAAIVITNLK